MLEVKINNQTQQLPESWNELTPKAAGVFAKCVSRGMEEEEIKLEMLLHYFPELKKTIKKLDKAQQNGDHKQYWEKTELLYLGLDRLFNFFWKEVELEDKSVKIISSELTNQLVPGIKGLVGPENFSKLEIWEFSLAEMAWEDFFENSTDKSLYRLVAILYRPKIWFHGIRKRMANYKGDPRQEFNDQLLHRCAGSIAKIPFSTMLLIAWWFEGNLKKMPETFPKLYEKKQSRDEDLGEKGSWSDTILLIARNEHKEADQVAKRNMFQFMRERELQIIEREVQERELEKMRNKS